MINGVYHLDGLMRGLLQVNIDMMKNIFLTGQLFVAI